MSMKCNHQSSFLLFEGKTMTRAKEGIVDETYQFLCLSALFPG